MFNGPARSNVSERTTAGRNDLASLSRSGVILADNKFRYQLGIGNCCFGLPVLLGSALNSP